MNSANKTSFINGINSALKSSFVDNKTLYVLKGFNYFVDDLTIDKDLFLFTKSIIRTGQYNISDLGNRFSANEPAYCFFEDIVWLIQHNLGGFIEMSGYKVIVVENDLFSQYYPNSISSNNIETISMFESDKDNIIQLYYNDIIDINGILFISYNEIDQILYQTENITNHLPGFIASPNGTKVEIPDECSNAILSDVILNIINDDVSEVSLLREKHQSNQKVQRLVNVLKRYGFRITFRSYSVGQEEIDHKVLEEYTGILKRKNPDYDFYDIPIYEDPYESTNLTNVSQSKIINDIVTNVEKSQNEEDFRDVFITAPTGSGKSVMFQIPAIYLEEKYNLLTIVVTPLIGLMNDQVNSIKTMTNKAATINSDYTPQEKEHTLAKVKSGDVSILYLSPESLLSNTDISNLIGDRKIGLIVVDESHIVATWGKSFRPDYWYLGDFISKLRNDPKNEHRFPIVTFTATATFGGDDDMYQDIIESLKMTPIKYIGNVKRDDISFDIRLRTKEKAYLEEKLETATKAINGLQQTGEKTLVYVPYKRHITDIYEKITDSNKVGRYFGNMSAGEKNETLELIKTGDKNVVIATKAFGMGIDINDIKHVYHFAPTGNIADYVQEIGRAARKKDMSGIAMTDFFKEDFRYVNQLHGMSSIKNFQVVAVLQKIIELYKKNNKRNFMVSSDEFSYIFADCRPNEIDAKLKTTLLIIKKDLELSESSNFAPLIFKPRSMFTFGYFMINDDFISSLEEAGVLRFFAKLNYPRTLETVDERGNPMTITSPGDIYKLDFKSLWESKYKDLSFGMFKRNFFENELGDYNYKVGEKLVPRTILEISSKTINFGTMKGIFFSVMDSLNEIFDYLRAQNKHFTTNQLSQLILDRSSINKKHIADMVSQTIIYLLNRIELNGFNTTYFTKYNSTTDKYVIKNATYEKRIYWMKKTARKMLADNNSMRTVCYTGNGLSGKEVMVGQILQMLETADCMIASGRNPEFFIRVNSPYTLEKIVNNRNYVSKTVSLVGIKHKESCNLMEHFFTKLKTDADRWEFIEGYFLGKITGNSIQSADNLVAYG